MKTLVVYSHPNPKSFNHAILETVQKTLVERGDEVRVRDLYAIKWNPVLGADDFTTMQMGRLPADIQREQDELRWAERLVFIYPIWWLERPAVIKGYIDRVFSQGFAFRMDETGPKGLLTQRQAYVFQTTGGAAAFYKQFNAVDLIQRPMTDGTLRFCGITDVRIETFFGVVTASEAERRVMLAQTRERMTAW